MSTRTGLTLLFISLAVFLQAQQSIYQTVKDGTYTDPTVWDQGRIPPVGKNTAVYINHDIVAPFAFYGGLPNNWDLTVKTGGNLTFYGDVNLVMNASSAITVEEGATFIASDLILEDGAFVTAGNVSLDTVLLSGFHQFTASGGHIDLEGHFELFSFYDSTGHSIQALIEDTEITTTGLVNINAQLELRNSTTTISGALQAEGAAATLIYGGTVEAPTAMLLDSTQVQLHERGVLTASDIYLFNTSTIQGFQEGGMIYSDAVNFESPGASIRCVDDICAYQQGDAVPAELDLLTGAIVLPVIWGEIEAEWVETAVQVHWVTEQEDANAYFLVERTVDSNPDWDVLGRVEGRGQSQKRQSYDFTDTTAADLSATTILYRIRQVDVTNTSSVSPITSVTLTSTLELQRAQAFRIAPNPVQTEFRLLLPAPVDGAVVKLYDPQGRRIILSNHASGRELTLQFPAQFPAGIYAIEVTTDTYQHRAILYHIR